MLCMVRTVKMAVLLLSVHPLLDQCLLCLHPTHLTDLPAYLPQAQLVIVLIKGAVRAVPSLLVSLVTNEPTCHHFPL